jgi:hypothetical protein
MKSVPQKLNDLPLNEDREAKSMNIGPPKGSSKLPTEPNNLPEPLLSEGTRLQDSKEHTEEVLLNPLPIRRSFKSYKNLRPYDGNLEIFRQQEDFSDYLKNDLVSRWRIKIPPNAKIYNKHLCDYYLVKRMPRLPQIQVDIKEEPELQPAIEEPEKKPTTEGMLKPPKDYGSRVGRNLGVDSDYESLEGDEDDPEMPNRKKSARKKSGISKSSKDDQYVKDDMFLMGASPVPQPEQEPEDSNPIEPADEEERPVVLSDEFTPYILKKDKKKRNFEIDGDPSAKGAKVIGQKEQEEESEEEPVHEENKEPGPEDATPKTLLKKDKPKKEHKEKAPPVVLC